MVTFAQAQERAEEWINGDVPAYLHREVRLREFQLGFVVWAEDRDGGPRSDGGAQRLGRCAGTGGGRRRRARAASGAGPAGGGGAGGGGGCAAAGSMCRNGGRPSSASPRSQRIRAGRADGCPVHTSRSN